VNLNPMNLFRRSAPDVRGKTNDMSTSVIVRAGMTLGPWDALLQSFIPRKVNPYFFEALREASPLIDGGIGKLVVLDGLVRFEGKDQALCDEITAAMVELPVEDADAGLQAAYELLCAETYEQGMGLGEKVMDAKGRKLVGLRIADSKGVLARRNESGDIQWWYRPPSYQLIKRDNGTDQVEVVLRNNTTNINVTPGYLNSINYALLDPSRLFYNAFRPEPGSPYGVSIMRSMEFIAINLLKIQNATGNVWERFGDPSFQLTYKTKNRALKGLELDKRKLQLANDLSAVLNAKKQGNSADFVQAIGADDDIVIEIIGGKGDILEIETPSKHFVEQMLAKMPIPGWMMGLSEAQAGRMADQQSEMVLMEAKTRFERRKPALKSIVATWLRGQGVTWKPGDWDIIQELPNLRDIMKQAQARFLNAQADMMSGTLSDNPQTSTGITASLGGDPNSGKFAKIVIRNKVDGTVETEFHPRERAAHKHVHRKGAADDDESEPWAEDDDVLPSLEAAAMEETLALWDQLAEQAMQAIGVAEKAGGSTLFTFDASTMLQPLLDNEQIFIDAAGGDGGPLLRNAFDAFLRGVANAASDMDVESTLNDAREELRADLATRDLQLVKDGSVRTFHDGILKGLQDGAYDGLNPSTVAKQLGDAFDLQGYNWERLARSEIAAAHGAGKIAQYQALGVSKVDFVTAGGACPICEDLAGKSPYDIADAPMPVDDSHPNCRCSLLASQKGSNAPDDEAE
jgi:SPP1 gp7 family putative phage head morphogenesis protein